MKVSFDLTNEEYHNGEEYADFISSSELKNYAVSPKYAREMMDQKSEPSSSMRLGTLFHEAMEKISRGCSKNNILADLAVFNAPINTKTGKAYGNTSKEYQSAYNAFLEENNGKTIATPQEKEALTRMLSSVMANNVVKKFLAWGAYDEEKMTGPEISILGALDGVKVKVRPDLLTTNKIIDWKTTSVADLRQETIIKTILNFKYDVSAALYQMMLHELTCHWYGFYWVFVQTVAPYDCVVVDAMNFAYAASENEPIGEDNHGAVECKTLLDIHKECMINQEWKNSDIFIKPDDKGNRILVPECPKWAMNNLTQKY